MIERRLRERTSGASILLERVTDAEGDDVVPTGRSPVTIPGVAGPWTVAGGDSGWVVVGV
jgi:hypothetical protein